MHLEKRLSNRALSYFYSALLVGAILLAYQNTLHSPFVFDDESNIIRNRYIQIEELNHNSLRKILSQSSTSPARPVANISFALNYLVGRYNTFGYHLVNIFIHIITALVVFRLFVWYGKKMQRGESDTTIELAFAAALLWAVNPIQTSAVTYIVQRMTSLCTLFFLSSLIVYLHARDLISEEGFLSGHVQKAALLLASLLLWVLAMGTKEIAAIMPGVLLLHEVYFFDQLSWQKIRAKKYLYLGLLLIPLILGGYALTAGLWQTILIGYTGKDFTMMERVLTQSRVVLHYMSLFLCPIPSRLTLFYDYQISRSLIEPATTLLSVLTLAALLVGSCLMARRFPLISFGIIWTLLCLLIESSIVPLELVFEHRFYLPSVGFILAVTGAISLIFNRLLPSKTGNARAFLLGVGIILVFMTFIRNQDWRSETSLYLDAAQKTPGQARAANALAVAYIREGRYIQGIGELERALAIDPNSVVALANLFALYTDLGKHQLAQSFLERLKGAVTAGNLDCHEATNITLISEVLVKQKKYEDVIFLYESLAPCEKLKSPIYYDNLGLCYAQTGHHLKAIENFKKCLSFDAANPYYLFSLTKSYLLSGDKKNAEITLKRLQEAGIPQGLQPQVQSMAKYFLEN